MPANLVNARQGVLGQLVKVKETDGYDVDPASPVNVVVPMSDAENLVNTQPLNDAVIGDGRRSAKGSWLGMIDDSGDVPVSLDYDYVGHDLICHIGEEDENGNPVYTRAGSNHKWSRWGVPISFQIEKRHTQAPAIKHRHKGVFSTIFALRPAAAGQAVYTLSHLGVGDFVRTASGGTDLDYYPFTVNNYFNGFLKLNGTELADIIAFTLTLDSKVTRKDAYFHAGMAAAVNFGVPVSGGTLGRIFSVDFGDDFLDLAIDETISEIECVYFNAPPSAGPTEWLRIILPAVRFSRRDPNLRPNDSEDQTLDFKAQVAEADRPAEVIGSTVGTGSTFTRTIPAAMTVVLKIDGAGAITVPALTTGTRTLAQVVTEINAYGPFAAGALAFAWNGHLGVRSLSTVAATSKIQFQAGGAAFNTMFGFDTTIWSGTEASDLYVELQNSLTADY